MLDTYVHILPRIFRESCRIAILHFSFFDKRFGIMKFMNGPIVESRVAHYNDVSLTGLEPSGSKTYFLTALVTSSSFTVSRALNAACCRLYAKFQRKGLRMLIVKLGICPRPIMPERVREEIIEVKPRLCCIHTDINAT